jgi:chromosome segregation ATPase
MAAISPACLAQVERSGGGGGNAQLMAQLQQLAAERARLQADAAVMKGELEKARKERDSLKAAQEGAISRSRGAQADLGRALADKARLEGELAQERSRLQELVTRYREVTNSLREAETGGAQSRERVAMLERDQKACVERNARLYELNGEILTRLDGEGFWSGLARNEPFTQLKRVQLENLAEDYRARAADNALAP